MKTRNSELEIDVKDASRQTGELADLWFYFQQAQAWTNKGIFREMQSEYQRTSLQILELNPFVDNQIHILQC